VARVSAKEVATEEVEETVVTETSAMAATMVFLTEMEGRSPVSPRLAKLAMIVAGVARTEPRTYRR
jgi:hypothetical protein